MHVLLFNKENLGLIILYKMLTLIVQGKCINCTRGVEACIYHRIEIIFLSEISFLSRMLIHQPRIFFFFMSWSMSYLTQT